MAESFKEVIQLTLETLGEDAAASLAAALKGVGDAGSEVGAKLAPMLDQLQKLADQSAKVSEALDLQQRLQANSDALAAAKQSLADLNAEFSRTDKSSADVTVAFAQAEKQVKSLAAEQLKLQNASASSNAALQASGVDTANLGAANDALKTKAAGVAEQIQKTATAAKDAGDSTRKLGDESQRSTGLLSGLEANLGKIAIAAGAAIAAFEALHKVVAFAGDSLNAAAGVEQSLARVQALAKGTADDFGKMGAAIEAAAVQTNSSSEQAAAALAALAGQGKSAQEAMAALVPTLQLAKIAGIDVGQAAAFVSDNLDRFGLSADQSAHVVDVLATASKGAKDGLAGIADGMGKLAPLARDIGLDFDHTASLLGFFAQNGFSAETAAKGLKTVFEELGNPASKLRQSLFDLGDGSKDFDTALKTLSSSGARGREALDGLSASAKNVLLFMLQQGPAAFTAFSGGIANATGAAEKLSKAIDDTLSGSFTAFKGAISEIGVQLATPLLAPLRDEFEKLAGQLNTFAASPAFDEIRTALGAMFVDGVKGFDDFIQHVKWGDFVADAKTSIGEVAEKVKGLADNLGAAATAINVTASTIGLAFHAVMVVLNGVATAFYEVNALIGKAELAASKMADKLRGGTSDLTLKLIDLNQTAQDAADNGLASLRDHSEKLAADFDTVTGSSLTAGDAVAGVGEKAAAAVPKVEQLAPTFDAVSSAVGGFTDDLGLVPDYIQRVTDKTAEFARTSRDQADALDAASARFAAARAEMDRLARSGDGNAEAFRKAQIEYAAAGAELDRLRGHADNAAAGGDALKAALDALGGSSQKLAEDAGRAANTLDATFAAFQAGTQTLGDVKIAFDAYAAAQRASVQNSEQWAQDQVEANLRVKESLLGLGNIPPPNTKPLTKPLQDVAQANREVIDTSTTASRAIAANAEVAKHAGASISGTLGPALTAMSGFLGEFGAHSVAAAARYNQLVEAVFNGAGVFSSSAISDGTGIIRFGEAVGQAAKLVRVELDQQSQAAEAAAASYAGLSDKAIASMAAAQGGSDRLVASLQEQAQAAREGRSQFELLGAADLSQLAAALDAAAAKTAALAQQAIQAKQQLESMASSLQDQIDQINGQQGAIEERRFQQQLDDLKKQADAGGAEAQAGYDQAVALANQLHALKMKQIADQAAAAAKAAGASSAAQATAATTAAATQPAGSGAFTPAAQRQAIDITLNGTGLGGINPNDTAAMTRFAQQLLPRIIDALRNAAMQTGGFH